MFIRTLLMTILGFIIAGCHFISYKDPTKEVFYGSISKKEKEKKIEVQESENK